MNLVCPFCSARFRAAVNEPLKTAVRLACPACQRQMVLRPQGSGRRQVASGKKKAAAKVRRKAIIADEARPFRGYLQEQLQKLGFDVTTFEAGDTALDAVRKNGADLVIINVALKKGKMGIELAEEIKKDPAMASARVALTGPLFRANRFRSDPAALYGADEYIEEQIPAEALELRLTDLFDHARDTRSQDADAQRLARLILSDIVIAHPDRVEKGIRGGDFFEVLKKEIDEGRAFYETHIPYRIRQSSEYFTEVFQDFFDMKREEL